MVTAALKDLLVALEQRSVQIYVDDGRLKTRCAPGAITAEIAAGIREHKEALLQLLESAATPASVDAVIPRAAPREEYPLSYAQQRLWFLDQFEAGAASYNMPSSLRLTGELDRDALQRALDEVVRRHAVLRTRYRLSGGVAVQVVTPAQTVAIQDIDLSAGADGDQALQLAECMRVEAARRFDLGRDVMLRATLVRMRADEHVLLLTLHHIAADGWSLGVLVREITSLYAAFREGRASPLQALEIQYLDFAQWQRDTVQAARVDAAIAFWRDALDGIPQLHNLPLDKPRPLQLQSSGRTLRCDVDTDVLEAMRGLAGAHGATLFMALQAAFALLLGRWSGDEDIVVGTPVAGRTGASTENLIGCFINSLALRTTLQAGQSFSGLLGDTRRRTLAAYEHQHVPFEMLVEAINPERSLSHTPLFQIMFALQNYEVGALHLPGLVVEELPNDHQASKFDLALLATEQTGKLTLTWVFADSLFDEATIASMASSFTTLLRAIVAEPNRDVYELPIVSAAHAAQLAAYQTANGDAVVVCDGRGVPQPPGAIGFLLPPTHDAASLPAGADATGALASLPIGRLRHEGVVETLAPTATAGRLSGMRIPLGRIEAALQCSGRVAALHVAVRTPAGSSPSNPCLVAYVVPTQCADALQATADRAAFQAELQEHLRQQLPDFMRPRQIVVLDHLPLDATGKVAADELPVPVAEPTQAAAYTPPVRDLESQLCTMWCTVLGLERVGTHDNFFEVGGTSLHSILLQQEMEAAGFTVSVTDLFAYPTVAALADFLERGEPIEATGARPAQGPGARTGRDAVAIIGMAGRFPDASTLETFWQRLRDGAESLTTFSDEELLGAGVDPALLAHPDYVKSGVLLDHIQEFDADYFGFTPREVEVMDPQQRVLFECAVEALELAGYGNHTEKRAVGVFVGVGESRYLFEHLLPQAALIEPMRLAALYGNRPDFAATRLSYRLNLTGPSVTVGTACSTSLVAIHQACLSVLDGECEMALAGGAAIAQLGPQGYLYQEGSIASRDGHCRAFDRAASGTRPGSGAGLVVLKRLDRAMADGDPIYAVVKGSAVNNDGTDKVGYTAPSVAGQAAVIREAQRVAGVEPASIQYVEAHGTATELGDPIEFKALVRAFGPAGANRCAIGSVKTNIGHLDSAAGVAGFIKTVQALAHRQIPASLHFHEPNPKLELERSPFFINTRLRDWPTVDGPRRAAVSSFGIGGTNAHVVLEEAPSRAPRPRDATAQLLLVSARSPEAAAQRARVLADHLAQHPDLDLADVAFTLQAGRAPHAARLTIVATTPDEAAAALRQAAQARAVTAADRPGIVFMFTGQGAQHLAMGRELYMREPQFRAYVDASAPLFTEETGTDLIALLFAPERSDADVAALGSMLRQTAVAQPALFVIEHAMASLLLSWGLEPEAMIGHSLGEYVAACLAGVFAFEDGLRLVARRGRLMQGATPGRMVSVTLGEADAAALFSAAQCCLAAVNGPADCVASGADAAIDALIRTLDERGVTYRELRTSHAFHSTLMRQVAAPFRALVASMDLKAPKRPYVSNVSGQFITPEQAVDPDYWVRHMLGTVRFADGVATLAAAGQERSAGRIYVELGPGRTLGALVRKHPGVHPERIVATLCGTHDHHGDQRQLLAALGTAWAHGAWIDWSAVRGSQPRCRVALPTYPFQRKRFWIERPGSTAGAVRVAEPAAASNGLYSPCWTPLTSLPVLREPDPNAQSALWLLYCDDDAFGASVRAQLHAHGAEVVVVHAADRFSRQAAHTFSIAPEAEADHAQLLRELDITRERPVHVIHLWSTTAVDATGEGRSTFDRAQAMGFYSVLYLSRALAASGNVPSVTLHLVTTGAVSVSGEEDIVPARAPVLGLLKVIPQEFPQIRVHHIDLPAPLATSSAVRVARAASQVVNEATSTSPLLQVAYRGPKRWSLTYLPTEPATGPATFTVRAGGVYVITGGLGRIGLLLAEHLVRRGAAGIALISRTPPPDGSGAPSADDRQPWSREAGLRRLRETGARICVHSADVGDYEQMRTAFDRIEHELGPIDGVIHCAGRVHDVMQSLESLTPAACETHFRAKVHGTHVLERLMDERGIGFCLLMSSLSSVLGGLGFGAYAAANSYLDAFAQHRHNAGDPRWLAVNWDGWLFLPPEQLAAAPADRAGMTPDEGLAAFDRVLQLSHLPQIVNSTMALHARIEQWLELKRPRPTIGTLHPRPAVQTPYVEPHSPTEHRLAAIWQDVLGIEPVGVRDNFFELGGDSVMLVQVHKAIRATVDKDVVVASLFQFPSIAELAQFLDRSDNKAVAQSVLSKRLERRKARGASGPLETPA